MAAVGMPPHILALFQPRPPLEDFPALSRRTPKFYVGIGSYVDKFESTPAPQIVPFETPRQRWARLKRERLTKHLQKQQELIKNYTPAKDPKLSGDPFCTLFVSKMSYETTEKKLRREFEQYGPIKRVRIIYDKDNNHRGYGFIEFENDKDMKEAYKKGDGAKIDGRRVLVDVERARTVPGWLPRRLGGGRGPPRGGGRGGPDISNLLIQQTMQVRDEENRQKLKQGRREKTDRSDRPDRERRRSRSRERKEKRRERGDSRERRDRR